MPSAGSVVCVTQSHGSCPHSAGGSLVSLLPHHALTPLSGLAGLAGLAACLALGGPRASCAPAALPPAPSGCSSAPWPARSRGPSAVRCTVQRKQRWGGAVAAVLGALRCRARAARGALPAPPLTMRSAPVRSTSAPMVVQPTMPATAGRVVHRGRVGVAGGTCQGKRCASACSECVACAACSLPLDSPTALACPALTQNASVGIGAHTTAAHQSCTPQPPSSGGWGWGSVGMQQYWVGSGVREERCGAARTPTARRHPHTRALHPPQSLPSLPS